MTCILSRLKSTVTKRNFPDGAYDVYTRLFASVGAVFLSQLRCYPARPSEAPDSSSPSNDTSFKQDMLMYLFLAVNNLQADDVTPGADSHAPYSTKIADYVFREYI
jgi:hypothetical protein